MSTEIPEEATAKSTSLTLSNVTSQQQICSLVLCAIQHLLCAKGQVYEPITVLQLKRAREHIAEAQQKSRLQGGDLMRPTKRSGQSIQKRRKDRKTDELLTALLQLQQSLSSAFIQLQQSSHATEEVVILLRFGQSRLSCRQQICIRLQGIHSLAAVEPPLQDVKAKRQKISMMERKLVRFLLSLSAENESFIKLINMPMNRTRTHLFLLAPATFSCRGWTRCRAVRGEDLEAIEGNDMDLSPYEMAEKGREMGFKQELVVAASNRRDEHLDKAEKSLEDPDDFDTRRLEKLQVRAMQRAAKRQTKGTSPNSTAREKTSKVPLTASFTIDCNSTHTSQLPHKLAIQEAYWFACKTILKGVQ